MLVRVPVLGPNDDPWQIGREVITDLKGRELTSEEIQRHNHQRALQQESGPNRGSTAGVGTSSSPSQTSMNTPAIIASREARTLPPINLPFHTNKVPRSNCCQHRKNIKEHNPPVLEVKYAEAAGMPQAAAIVPTESKRVQCSCGPGCTCAFCYDHPNNATSRQLARKQAMEYGGLVPMQQQSDQSLTVEEMNSCMGTSPWIRWTDNPNPNETDLKNMFGIDNMSNGGYLLSYPVRGFSPSAFEGPAADNSQPQLDLPIHMGENFGDAGFSPSNAMPQEGMIAMAHGSCDHNYAGMQQHMLQQDESQMTYPNLNSRPPTDSGAPPFYTSPWIGEASVAGIYSDWGAVANITSNWPTDNTYQDSYMSSYIAPQEGTFPSGIPASKRSMILNPGSSGADLRPPKPMATTGSFHVAQDPYNDPSMMPNLGTSSANPTPPEQLATTGGVPVAQDRHNDPSIRQDLNCKVDIIASMPRASITSTTTTSDTVYPSDSYIHSPDNNNRPDDSG